MEPGNCLPGHHSGQAVVLSNVVQDARHFPGIDALTGAETRSLIALSLKRWEGTPVGVLDVLNKRGGQLGGDDLDILCIKTGTHLYPGTSSVQSATKKDTRGAMISA